jgi:hypothetical protein
LELELLHFVPQGIATDVEKLGGTRLVAAGT